MGGAGGGGGGWALGPGAPPGQKLMQDLAWMLAGELSWHICTYLAKVIKWMDTVVVGWALQIWERAQEERRRREEAARPPTP